MLQAADAALVRRDRALPGLRTILDPEALGEALRRRVPGLDVEGVDATYVRYKAGTNCLARYQLRAAGRVVDLHAKAILPADEPKLTDAEQRPGVPGALGAGRLVLREQCVIVSVFPNDAKLSALAALGEPGRREHVLRRALPGRPDLWSGSLHPLRYKPERRWVALLRGAAGGLAILKTHTDGGYRQARPGASGLTPNGVLRIAQRIGKTDRYRCLVYEWLGGRVVSEALADDAFDPGMLAQVGAAAAALHHCDRTGFRARERDAEALMLAGVADGIAEIAPALAERARRLAGALAAQLAAAPAIDRPIHGDFYAKQVLAQGDGVALLDFDEASRGDPAADIGNFIAHLERDALRGSIPPSRLDPARSALLGGYAAAVGRDCERVELYTSIGLMRIASHPFRQREPEWTARTDALLARAESLLPSSRAACVIAPAAVGAGRDARTGSAGVAPSLVDDPDGAATDPALPWLAQALDPSVAERELGRLPWLTRAGGAVGAGAGGGAALRLAAIRVVRHKPGRRAIIEYDVTIEQADAWPRDITLVGKVRARGVDMRTYELIVTLWTDGQRRDPADGFAVPEPVGILPAFRMWLQRKVPGTSVTAELPLPGGAALAERIAEGIDAVHRHTPVPRRRHAMADEIRILGEQLGVAMRTRPAQANRISRILAACERVGASVRDPEPCGIHRDFYPDQLLMDGARLYLLDWDLFCAGDPALDVGNFIAHLIEQGIREHGAPDALADRAAAMEERFVELQGDRVRSRIGAYLTMTLARHIALSMRIPGRRHTTGMLLDLCERRLRLSRGARSSQPPRADAALVTQP